MVVKVEITFTRQTTKPTPTGPGPIQIRVVAALARMPLRQPKFAKSSTEEPGGTENVMCGICGIFGPVTSKSMGATMAMNDSIKHRGPDAEGLWSDQSKIILGHRRLSILDTSDAANQPMTSNDGRFVIILNGEIYNYVELREELQSIYSFKTNSDTEVALACFERWGSNAFRRFNGMFALAIWDKSSNSLMLARDRLGIKPLYYHQLEGSTTFASEIRALLGSEQVPKRLDRTSVSEFLRYQTVHAPNTLIESVKQLEAGTFLVIKNGSTKQHTWWDPAESAIPWDSNRENLTKHIREILLDSVRLRMRSDVPFGAFLSGGIDSSAIVGLMAELSLQPVHTFSVVVNEGEFDESAYSRDVARRFNTSHHEIRLSADDFLEQIPFALDAIDHPSGDGPNMFVVSQATKNAGITVALSGLGSDELFAGYPVFRRSLLMQNYHWLGCVPRSLRKLMGRSVLALRNTTAARKLVTILENGNLDIASTYPISRQFFLEDEIQRIWRVEHTVDNIENRYKKLLATKCGSTLPALSKVSIGELGFYMQHVLLRDTDQMSMAHALEVRVPFLDHRLVECLLGVPDSYKYPNTPKQLLTDSLDGLLPPNLTKRRKMGFVLPWEHWMRIELKSVCQTGLAALSQVEGFDTSETTQIWQSYLARKPEWSWSRIWLLVALGHWIKRHNLH